MLALLTLFKFVSSIFPLPSTKFNSLVLSSSFQSFLKILMNVNIKRIIQHYFKSYASIPWKEKSKWDQCDHQNNLNMIHTYLSQEYSSHIPTCFSNAQFVIHCLEKELHWGILRRMFTKGCRTRVCVIFQARNHLKFALDSFPSTLVDLQYLSHLSTEIVNHHLLFVLALLNHVVLGECKVKVLGSFCQQKLFQTFHWIHK